MAEFVNRSAEIRCVITLNYKFYGFTYTNIIYLFISEAFHRLPDRRSLGIENIFFRGNVNYYFHLSDIDADVERFQ